MFWGFFVTYSLGVLFFQVQIPSKTDKPGGSPVRQMAQEVRNRRGSLLLLYVVNVWLISEAWFCVFRISCQLRCCCPQSTNWTSSSLCCLQIVLGFYFERACCDITVWCDLWPMQVFPVSPDPPSGPLGAHAARGAAGHHGTISNRLLRDCVGPRQVSEQTCRYFRVIMSWC